VSYVPGRSDQPLEDTGERADTRTIARIVGIILVLVVALLFMTQNSQKVKTSFIFFTVETRLWVSLLVALLLGVVVGQGAEALWHRRQRRREGRAEH
jgi:uncharacterized integral membrane protein